MKESRARRNAQQTAVPSENPGIFDRLDRISGSVSAEERLEAEARARVWADQYPSGKQNAMAGQ